MSCPKNYTLQTIGGKQKCVYCVGPGNNPIPVIGNDINTGNYTQKCCPSGYNYLAGWNGADGIKCVNSSTDKTMQSGQFSYGMSIIDPNGPITKQEDCEWTPWTQWSSCSVSCGGGVQSETRAQYLEQNGGLPCVGLALNTQQCNKQECVSYTNQLSVPVDCKLGPWSEWTPCSETCNGIQSQTRERTPAQNGGKDCPSGPDIIFETCDTPECKRDCTWNTWSTWSSCTKPCGGGVKTETRGKYPEQDGGKPCLGEWTNTEECNTQPCPVDCNPSMWVNSNNCTGTCGGGKGTITQVRTQYPPKYGGIACDGITTQEIPCINNAPCQEQICIGSSKGDVIGKCNATVCGTTGTEEIITTFDQDAYGVKDCKINTIKRSQPCNAKQCPVDCSISPWDPWTTCSKPCSGGVQLRKRTVKTPASNGGKDCTGPLTQQESCNTQPCPIDCKWTPWSEWTTCSLPCKDGDNIGVQSELRTKIPAQYNGIDCVGPSERSQICNTQPCIKNCTVNSWQPLE